MSKSTLRSIKDAVTHSGPSYNPPLDARASLDRTKFLRAFTHSGPSYEPGSTRKISLAEATEIARDELVPLVASIRPLITQVKKAVGGLDPDDSKMTREGLQTAQNLLRQVVELIEIDYVEITNRLQRGAGPLDLRTHFMLWKQRKEMLSISREVRQIRELASEALQAMKYRDDQRSRVSSDLVPALTPAVAMIFQRLDTAARTLTV